MRDYFEIPSSISPQVFQAGIEKRLYEITELLSTKGKEYQRDNNPFHNFEQGAVRNGVHPIDVLRGFMLKHEVSVVDICNDLIEEGKVAKPEHVAEKIQDILIYYLILEQMINYYSLQQKTEE